MPRGLWQLPEGSMSSLVHEARPLYERRTSFWRRLSSLLVQQPVHGPLGLAAALDAGLAPAAVDRLVREGYLKHAEVGVVAPRRTLSHRKDKGQRLRRHESEQLARFGKTILLAEQVFGEKQRALDWLHAPKRRFGGKTPFELLATAAGGQIVEEELVSIDEGYVA